MSRSADFIPTYRKHKATGQAVVTLRTATGTTKDVYLGEHRTAASRKEYARVIAEWEAAGRTLPGPAADDLTVAELLARWNKHARDYYKPRHGGNARTVDNFKDALRVVNHLYGMTPAKDFGALALKSCRELMIAGYEHPRYGKQRGLARGTINRRVVLIRHVFKWAAENELIPASVHHSLMAVGGLRYGRSEARETEKVGPVPVAFVEETIKTAPPVVSDMIHLQRLTGMGSGEMCIMRVCDLDTSGPVWLYRPSRHKTMHFGHERIVALGPKAQAIIKNHLTTQLEAFIFSPAKQREMIYADRRAARKTKVQPSQICRKKTHARRLPKDRYTPSSYAYAVQRAAEKAGVPHWHPHQLRHLVALELKRKAGLDVARACLGHRSPVLTEHYASLDVDAAAEVMLKIG